MRGWRSRTGRYRIDGEIKNHIGNGEAKELTCATHGHELREELLEERGVPGGRGHRGESWDNFNSIINKIYFKKPRKVTLVHFC